MFDILTLKAKNHVHYKDLEIDFRKLKDNLIFVTGQNFETAGSKSNGSGKSVIGDLFTDLLFDKTVRRHSPKSFIGKFAKWSYGSISIIDTITKDIYFIKKYRNHPQKGDKVLFIRKSFKGNKKQDLSRKKKADTYKIISKVLDISWETFRNRNYYGQRDFKRFLNVTDSEKAKIIVDIKDLKDLQKCKEVSHIAFSKVVKEINLIGSEEETLDKQISVINSSIKTLQMEIDQSKKIGKVKLAELEEEEKKILQKISYARNQTKGIEEIRNKLRSLKRDIEEIDKIVKEQTKQREILLELQDFLRDKTREKTEVSGKISGDKIKGRDVKNQVLIRCSECKAKLNKVRIENTLITINKRIKSNREKEKSLEKKIKGISPKISIQEEIIENLEGKIQRFMPTIKRRERFLKTIRKMEKWEAVIPVFLNESFSLEARISSEREKVKNPLGETTFLSLLNKKEEIEEQLKEVKVRHSKIAFERDKHFFSEQVYENTIRTLFNSFLDNLNYFSNLYLDIMSDSDIEVIFSSKAERASEKIVDEINVKVKINKDEPRPFRTYSGGETGKIEFSTQIALFSSADSPFPFLFLDEPFVGMDPVGIDRAIELLKQKADEGTKILVISHEDIVSGYGGNINVTRKDGESYLEFS